MTFTLNNDVLYLYNYNYMEQKGIRMYSHLLVDIAHEPGIKSQQAYLRKYKAYALTLVRLCAINYLKR